MRVLSLRKKGLQNCVCVGGCVCALTHMNVCLNQGLFKLFKKKENTLDSGI